MTGARRSPDWTASSSRGRGSWIMGEHQHRKAENSSIRFEYSSFTAADPANRDSGRQAVIAGRERAGFLQLRADCPR